MHGMLNGMVLLALAALPLRAIAAPVAWELDQRTVLAPKLNLALDRAWFSGEPRLHDGHGVRRAEIGLALEHRDVFELTAVYDVDAGNWADVFVQLDSRAWKADAGRLRLGQIKVPFGLEGLGSSSATSFLETALATQLVFPGRRVGLEWSRRWQATTLRAAYFSGNDLDGGNPGSMAAARAVWAPRAEPADVLHLGLSAAQESPQDAATVRLRARPESNLAEHFLFDSGALPQVNQIRRAAIDGLWIKGGFSLQGELLQARLARDAGQPDVRARGHYLTASWVPGGASRSYADGSVGNVKPGSGTASAFEFLLRYSHAQLETGATPEHRAHSWTLGSNWYLGQYLKFQLNLVQVRSAQPALLDDHRSLQARMQLAF